MLTWQPPHLIAIDHQRAPRTIPFCEVQRTYFQLWESYQLRFGSNHLHNPRDLFHDHLNKLRANVTRFLVLQEGAKA